MHHRQILLFLFARGMTTIFLDGGLDVEWPRRSPSLTVRGFFLWGWAKEEACPSQPRTLAEAEQKPSTYLSPRFPRRLKKCAEASVNQIKMKWRFLLIFLPL